MLWWTLLLLRWAPARMRLDAVIELGRINNVRAVGPLIAALERNPGIRSEIAMALGKIGDPRASDPLMALLLDESARTRASVSHALGMIGDVRAVPPLVAVLASDDMPAVSEAAAESLALCQRSS
jgi:HEAT repeat protein